MTFFSFDFDFAKTITNKTVNVVPNLEEKKCLFYDTVSAGNNFLEESDLVDWKDDICFTCLIECPDFSIVFFSLPLKLEKIEQRKRKKIILLSEFQVEFHLRVLHLL